MRIFQEWFFPSVMPVPGVEVRWSEVKPAEVPCQHTVTLRSKLRNRCCLSICLTKVKHRRLWTSTEWVHGGSLFECLRSDSWLTALGLWMVCVGRTKRAREPCDIGPLPRSATLETKWHISRSNKGTHTLWLVLSGLLELPQGISISPKNPSLHAIHFCWQPGYCKDQPYVLSSVPQAL